MSPVTSSFQQISKFTDKSHLKVGCVPEHFSAPLFQQSSSQTLSMPCGTGEMIEALEKSEIHLSVSLTEGIIAKAVNQRLENIDNNNSSRPSTNSYLQLMGSYTDSPLTWSIAIAPNAPFTSVRELKRIGISRYGSGSHVMAIVLGMQLDIEFEYVVCGNIKGLLESTRKGESDAFLWEIVTTKPYYDDGLVEMLDTLTSPWPAFVFASTAQLSTSHSSAISTFIRSMRQSIDEFTSTFRETGKDYIMKSPVFHYKSASDLDTWFKGVAYSKNLKNLAIVDLQKCVDILCQARVIDSGKLAQWESLNPGTSIIEEICNLEFVQLK